MQHFVVFCTGACVFPYTVSSLCVASECLRDEAPPYWTKVGHYILCYYSNLVTICCATSVPIHGLSTKAWHSAANPELRALDLWVQVVHYDVSQQYREHWDYFDQEAPGYKERLGTQVPEYSVDVHSMYVIHLNPIYIPKP